jgi:hypothetical protein
MKIGVIALLGVWSFGALAQKVEKKDTIKINLKEVSVDGRKKIYEQKVDRLVFNIENSINANNGDAVDVLKITPSVVVSSDDKIALVGKQDVKVMVNGRLLNISGENLVNYLRTIQSKDIEKIEVITVPGAQYDAEGNSGLINIKLKGVKQDNFSGAVNGTFTQAKYANERGGFNLNYKKNKWTASTNFNYFGGKGYNENSINQKNGIDNTYVDTKIKQTAHFENFVTGLNLDYDINKKSSIGAKYLGMFSKMNVAIPTNSLFGQNDVYLGNIDQQIEAPIKINSHSLNLHYIQELNNRGAKLNTDWDYFSFNNEVI